MVLRSKNKAETREDETPISVKTSNRVPRIAFGLVPLTTPYSGSDPEFRILNAISRGLLYERIKTVAEELQMSKLEYNRILRSLRNSGSIYVTAEGKYRFTFDVANFPNLTAREDGW